LGHRIENDFSWTNKKGSGNLIPPFMPAANTFETNEKWLDTQRVRLGVAWDRWLVYGTAGVAFAKEGIILCSPLAISCGSASHTVMAGPREPALNTPSGTIGRPSSNISTLTSARVSSRSYHRRRLPRDFFFLARDVRLTNHIVRVGLAYKFDWFSPVTAKY